MAAIQKWRDFFLRYDVLQGWPWTSVYRITSSTEASKNEESDAASSEENESSTQEILTVAAPTLPTEENAAQGTSEAAEAAVNRPASYTVQPGDTLIEISKKFYGSSQMVMQLKEVNGLDDINKIYIGQERLCRENFYELYTTRYVILF